MLFFFLQLTFWLPLVFILNPRFNMKTVFIKNKIVIYVWYTYNIVQNYLDIYAGCI